MEEWGEERGGGGRMEIEGSVETVLDTGANKPFLVERGRGLGRKVGFSLGKVILRHYSSVPSL